ncbi:MAG: DUF2828 domain-containing protein [Gemmatimonadaceae bacterium]|nr:DUF2828 domain-containing protein [Gemmatimonadaceae bacterium]
MPRKPKHERKAELVAQTPKQKAARIRRKKAEQAQKIAEGLINDPVYRAKLLEKMQDGTLHPSVQVALMKYAWGEPRQDVEITHVVPVRITHAYTPAPVPLLPAADETDDE